MINLSIRLKIFLLIVCLFFIIILGLKVINKKLEFKYGVYWYLIILLLMIVTIFDSILVPIKNFLGFEKISNMVFLIGFIVISLLTLSLSIKVSIQNNKIIKLSEEIALLKKDHDNEKFN